MRVNHRFPRTERAPGSIRYPRLAHDCIDAAAAVLVGLFLLSNASALPAQEVGSSPEVLKKLSVEELMNIEVTSVSRRPEKLSVAASAIQVITGEDIRRSGATTVPEALRLASNLEIAQIDSRQWAISARGFNSTSANKMLVLIDGRTVYTPLYAGVFWDVQDVLLEDIERIEVISGPGATLWGANAVNGVINITTKRAEDTQGPLISAEGGIEPRDAGALRYGGVLGNGFHYRAYGKYFERGPSFLPDGTSVSDRWHLAQGGFRVDGELSSRDAITLQSDIYQGRMEQPLAGSLAVGGGNITSRWSRTLSDRSHLQLQVYFDRTERHIPTSIDEHLNTYDVDFQQQQRIGKHNEVVWGAGYRLIDDNIVNPIVFGFLPPSVTRQWFNAFAQDEIAGWADRFHLTLGTKVEHNDYTGFEYEPSVRAAWRLNEHDTLWSAISRAVRTPSRIDRDFYAPSVPPFVLLQGGPDFRSERLIAYEMGYRASVKDRLSLSLATYYNDYADLRSVELVNPPAPFPILLGNGLRGESYGVELTTDYQVTSAWKLRAGLTELRLHFAHEPGSTDTSSGTSEAQDPKLQWSLRSSLDLPGSCQFDADLRHVSSIQRQALPGYEELNVRLAWQPRRALELSIDGQNLLHARHAEFGMVTPMLSSTRKEIERSVYGKVLWHLF